VRGPGSTLGAGPERRRGHWTRVQAPREQAVHDAPVSAPEQARDRCGLGERAQVAGLHPPVELGRASCGQLLVPHVCGDVARWGSLLGAPRPPNARVHGIQKCVFLSSRDPLALYRRFLLGRVYARRCPSRASLPLPGKAPDRLRAHGSNEPIWGL